VESSTDVCWARCAVGNLLGMAKSGWVDLSLSEWTIRRDLSFDAT